MSEDIGAREPAEPGTAAEPAEHNQVPGAAAPSYWYDRHLDLPPDVDSATPHAVAVAERPQRGGLRRTTLILGATAVLALGAGFGGGLLSAHTSAAGGSTATDTSLTQQSAANPVSADVSTSTDSVEKAASTVLPSVVSILATSGNSAGEGSGVILTANGLILTNNHVVDGATTLTVRFNDATTATATVVGTDAADDIAVIRAENVSGLTPATLGTSADLQVGEAVVAIGAPLGLSSSVTSGIVSALNRPVQTSSADSQQTATSTGSMLNAIQTDAAINPGNSGGPLIDLNGRVIGINSAIASLSTSSSQSGSIGVGFAIPIDQAARIAQELINNGTATTATLGADVTDDAASADAISDGALIGNVTSGGAAAAAGLRAGDVITAVGSVPIDSADALVATIRSQTPGATVKVTYTRGKASSTIEVTLGTSTA